MEVNEAPSKNRQNVKFKVTYQLYDLGPAPSQFTDKIFEITKTISSYSICSELNVDISKLGESNHEVDGRTFSVAVIDGVRDYLVLMRELFDFEAIKELFRGEKALNVRADALSGGDRVVPPQFIDNFIDLYSL